MRYRKCSDCVPDQQLIVVLPGGMREVQQTLANGGCEVAGTGGHRERLCQQAVHEWSHDIGHPAHLRKMRYLLGGDNLGPPGIPQCLNRHINTDLVSILETINNGLCCRVNLNIHTLNAMMLDTILKSLARKPHNSQRRTVHPRLATRRCDCHPDFPWILRREAMKPQCRQQADHPTRHTLARLSQTVIFRHVSICEKINSPSGTIEYSLLGQVSQMLSGMSSAARSRGRSIPFRRASRSICSMDVCRLMVGMDQFVCTYRHLRTHCTPLRQLTPPNLKNQDYRTPKPRD